ncbi:MAG: hypothetical protein E7541_04460 [Ruminococcaceae bacterium]|nr:hypothetical protein [Oscillospiraceae bacterium]
MADDLQTLQQQAAERVQRTQAYNRRVFEEHQERPALRPPAPTAPVTAVPPRTGGMDTEQLLLLGLAFLLWRAGCRMELILALLYLAL